jgi:DNA-binding MarR family transcriptional regulator
MSVFETQHRAESMAARVALTLIENACALWGMRTTAARAEGLPDLQACILVRIINSPEQELTVGALANALHLTAPTVSDSLKALVNKGYLKRRKNPQDGRVVFFGCTRRGKAAAERLSEWPSGLEESISGLDQGHQQGLMGALTYMLRSQIERGFQIPEAMCASCEHFEVDSWESDHYACALTGKTFSCAGLHTACERHVPFGGVN